MKYCSVDVSEVSLSMQHDAILKAKHENVAPHEETSGRDDAEMQKHRGELSGNRAKTHGRLNRELLRFRL